MPKCGENRSPTRYNALRVSAGPALSRIVALNPSIKSFDHLPEIVLSDVDDFHLALCVFLGIAGVGGVDHDGLAKFSADGTRWRFRRVGGSQHITNLANSLNPFVHQGDTFLGPRPVKIPWGSLGGGAPGHKLHDVLKLTVTERRPENSPELLFLFSADL